MCGRVVSRHPLAWDDGCVGSFPLSPLQLILYSSDPNTLHFGRNGLLQSLLPQALCTSCSRLLKCSCSALCSNLQVSACAFQPAFTSTSSSSSDALMMTPSLECKLHGGKTDYLSGRPTH